ncbi:MAG: ABC transporter ATP-binding protein [Bacteriovoracaceae bacterium]
MIQLDSVKKKFQTDFWAKPFWALDDVSFHVPEGKIVGFLGANGAGKTTSIKIILNFIRPSTGEVKFHHSLGKSREEILSKIGYVPERPYFYPHLTGSEFIHYMGKLNNLKRSEILVQIQRWAPRLKIDFALERKIRTYSKGMLQRLGFLCSLIHNPQLIILDEPVSGLDPIGRKEIKDVILEVNREGKTIFFSSHIVPDVEEICHSVIFLEKGKLVYQGSIDKLIHDNIKSTYEISYKNANQDLIQKIKCEAVEKEASLTDLISQNKEILSLSQEKLSLEEIIYKVKTKERVLLDD